MNHLPLSPQSFIPNPLPSIPPLPPAFPLGYFGTYATYYNGRMLICSPGVTIQKTLRSPHYPYNYYKQHVFHPGMCHNYNPSEQLWNQFSGPMNSFRPGASLVRMGRYYTIYVGSRLFWSWLDLKSKYTYLVEFSYFYIYFFSFLRKIHDCFWRQSKS